MTRKPRWRRDIRARTQAMLATLGETPVQIAASLERSGVRATPRSSGDCAIAVFLNAVLVADPNVEAVRVGGTEIILKPSSRWHRGVRIRLSEPLRDFVCSFDAGKFPELTRAPGVDSIDSIDSIDRSTSALNASSKSGE
jgi:hypothetical protein